LKEGEKVWGVFVDIYIINHDGNLIDASALGAIAALRTTMIPKLENDKIIRDELVKKLPVLHTPITVTVGKVLDKFIIDSVKEEEEVLDSKLTVAITEEGKICAMQKSGERGLTEDDVVRMIDLAVKKSKEIRKFL
jgi:exosome complex component RRP42